MQLTQAELQKKFPSPQMIRQMSYRGEGMPSDPIAHAIYADAEASYEAQKNKQEKGAATSAATQAAGEEDMQDPS